MTVYGAGSGARGGFRREAAADRIEFLMQCAHVGIEPARRAPPLGLAEPGGDAADQHAEMISTKMSTNSGSVAA